MSTLTRLARCAPLLALVVLGCGGAETPVGVLTPEAGCDAAAAGAYATRTRDAADARVPCSVAVDHARRLITVRGGVHEVPSPELDTDRPELSPDGRRVVYSTEDPTPLPFYILSAYESRSDDGVVWATPRVVRRSVGAVRSGTLESWFFPTYRPTGGGFLIGLGTARTDANGIPDAATMDAHFLDLDAGGESRDTILSARAMGFPIGDIPQGQRYSPDGRRIVFYTQSPGVQGLYLYDRATAAVTRLTTSPDRDPTFSADGRQIYFHAQTGDASAESAGASQLGVLTLGERGAAPARRLLDVAPGTVASAQHPAPVAGTDVFLYHRQPAAGSPSVLAARRACDGAASFDVVLEANGRPLVAAERPGTALRAREAVLLARYAADGRRRVFVLSAAAVTRIAAAAASSPCAGGIQ